jgi:hypothetical protein
VIAALAMIFLWPLAAASIFYLIYQGFGIHAELLPYIAVLIGIFAIGIVWWWHMVRHG